MGKEISYTKAFVVRFRVRCMMGWLVAASGSGMDGLSTAAISTL